MNARTAVLAAALAAGIAGAGPAAASDFAGVLAVEAGGGYGAASPRTAAYPAALNGGVVRARVFYGLTDALGVAATGQIAWYQQRQPSVSATFDDGLGGTIAGVGYGAPVTRTRLQDLGASLVYALDVLRVVPFLAAGVASLRAVEEWPAGERIEHDVVLRFEIGVDFAPVARLRVGAAAVFDTFLTQRADFTAQSAFLLRAALALGPWPLGRRGATR